MEKAMELRDLLKVMSPKPLMGEDFDKFHVETTKARGRDSAFLISDYLEINKDEPQKVLFLGHRGSGKSTELWKVRKNLESVFWFVTFSIRDEIDITDLNYVDLIFAILDKLMERATEEGINIDERIIDNLFSYWHDDKLIETLKIEKAEASVNAEAKIGFLNTIRASVKGVLSTGKETKVTVRKIIEPKLSQLIKGINDVLTGINNELRIIGKTPLVIIEDLDKLDIAVAEDLFLKHTNTLLGLNVHIVYTFPISLHYSEKFNTIKDSFNMHELLSMIKVKNREDEPNLDGKKVIKEIIGRRADLSIFEPAALDFIIEKSGGYLRHVFEMIQKAALSARSKDRNAKILDLSAAREAFLRIRGDFERVLSGELMNSLRLIHDQKIKKPEDDGNLMALLDCLSLIEYNGDRWCGIHPAVVDIIEEKSKVA